MESLNCTVESSGIAKFKPCAGYNVNEPVLALPDAPGRDDSPFRTWKPSSSDVVCSDIALFNVGCSPRDAAKA